MAIKIDDRSLNSAVWMVHRQNAQTVQLSHQLADAIYVQLAAAEGRDRQETGGDAKRHNPLSV
ncbi:MAG: hypothetical protein IIA65_02500 [Planctomycetes bacterium]|nr:hypothetical protein [Planctomycetota bacterium]